MKKSLLLSLLCLGIMAGARAQTCTTTISTYPYLENFDGATAPGWVSGGFNSSWALGTPAKTVINSAASGTKSWVTSLTGQYNFSEDSYVTSPCFNMTTLVQPVVEMKVWWNSEFSWDGAVLQSSIDNGVTWQNVGAFGDPNNWYNDNSISAGPGSQPGTTAEGWTGRNYSNDGSGGWVTAKHVLTGMGGKPNVKLRIAFASDTYLNEEGFAFDNFSIYETPANDASVASITSPVSPVAPLVAQPVSVTVKNYGTAPLTSATLGYSVNDVIQPTFAWTGNVALNATSAPVQIGTFPFPVGVHKIKAWSKTPNGAVDGNPANDTTSITINSCTSLTGTFTINKGAGATATNFTSFSSAAQALAMCGVSGPVTFNVVAGSGPYNEQVILPVIPGTSATNTITFEGNANALTSSTSAVNQGVITFDGADFVKFNNLVITLNTATTGAGVQLMNASDNNTISNCTINTSTSTTNSVVIGVLAGTSNYSSGNFTNNLLLQNNTINGGYYGILLAGLSGTTTGNRIIGNQVRDAYYYGISVENGTGTIIESNDISNPTRTNGVDIYAIAISRNTEGSLITKNRVHNTHDVATDLSGTVYGITVNCPAPAGSENIIANNLMYNVNNSGGYLYAFFNSGGDGAHYYYNSVSADNPAIIYNRLRGIYYQGPTANTKFINNNLSLSGPATSKHAIYLNSNFISLISNNNNFHVGNSGKVGHYAGLEMETLADWKTANSNAYDQNSVSTNPIFVNVATGNLQPGSGVLNNVGQPVAAVTKDFTGATRNPTNPDLGAYEFVPAANDVGISAILTPNTGCSLTTQETISVTLNNYGTAAQSNIPVSYTINGGLAVTGTYAGPLAPGASVTYNFATKADLSTPNAYTLVVRTNFTGDALPVNDAVTKIVTSIPVVNTFPYNQNFEAGAGGWTSGGIASSWTWGTPAKSVINSAASGTKAWVTSLTGQYNASEHSYVLGPCFNFSTLVAPIIQLKVWWSAEESWDGAVLQSSINGGATWQNVGFYQDPDNWYNDNSINAGPGGQPGTTAEGWSGTASNSTGSNGWVTAKHALTGLAGQSSVLLRLAFAADGVNQEDGFAFDDILIYETPTNDAGVTVINNQASACGLTTQETISITVKNFGLVAQSNIPVSYSINAGTPVTDVVPGPIIPNASVTFNFATKANLATVGTYTLEAKTNLAGDILTTNDATTKVISSLQTISTLPYYEGFENGAGGWTAGGANSSWALGTPAKTIINSAAAGTKSWVTSLAGQYNANEQSYVVGPCFNLSAVADPEIEMKIWWNSEFSYDGAVLQSSIDGGTTWINVGAFSDPNNWYNENGINSGPGGQPGTIAEGWSGAFISSNGSNGWVTAKHRLTGLGGLSSVQLRIAFAADNIIMDEGFAFDEIRIRDNSNNLSANSILPINKMCGFTASEQITAVVGNLGSTPASGFTISYTVDGGTPVTETFAGSLAGGSTFNFTFAQGANLAAPGAHTIAVTVTGTGDPDATNNTATYTVNNSTFSAIPGVFNFEPAGAGIAQLKTTTNPKSGMVESTSASSGVGSTKGLIMDGITNPNWTMPVGITNPWTSNPDNFSGIYFCFNPGSGNPTDSLLLTFDLKQLYKTANANTNFRVTVNGTPVGGNQGATTANTYRPPFNGTGGTTNWTKVKLNLTSYLSQATIQIGLESSVNEEYANGSGTANLLDNILVSRVAGVTGIKENQLQNVVIYPNPSSGLFNLSLPEGKAYNLTVTDLTGKVLKKQTAKGTSQFNLTGMAKGIYLLQISGEKGSAVRKLIVE